MLFFRNNFAILVFLCFSSSAALSQPVFHHCLKDGKKFLSDRPCESFGLKEDKRVPVSEMPPINTAQGLTEKDRQLGQAISERLKRDDRQQRIEQQGQRSKEAEEKRLNERTCADLWRRK